MNAKSRAALLTSCLFGGALCNPGVAMADTMAQDNADLGFTLTPYVYSVGYGDTFATSRLYWMDSPAANAAGTATGPSIGLRLSRAFTSSQNLFNNFREASGEAFGFALSDNYDSFNGSGFDVKFYQQLAVFNEGDTIDASSFAATNSSFDYHGSFMAHSNNTGDAGLIGDEAIVGFQLEEAGGTRYGFVQLEWFEDVEFDRITPSGGTSTVDLYLPTAWGFSDTLDQGIVVSIPAACPADLDGSGTLNIDDIDAFATAFLASDLAADFDGNGTLNVDDIDAFVAAFLAGC